MNETRTMLEESVNRLFADQLDWDALTRIEQTGWPQTLWEQVTDQGIDRVMASEDGGGMAASWGDAYSVLRACGRYAVPLPVAEAIVCNWLATEAGAILPYGVPGLVAEPMNVAGGHVELRDSRVPWSGSVSYIVGLAGNELIIAGSDGLSVDEEENIGRDARGRLTGKALITARHDVTLPSDAIHWIGALTRSAQIAGAGAAALDLAVQYANEREQFGRPLSKFQAIQHHLADLAGVVASVDAMALAACEAVDRRGIRGTGRNARFEIAAAKCRASDAVEKITRLSHQVHGAIGFTYEYGLHFLTRRLWAWRSEFGNANEWGAYLGGVAQTSGGDGIWPVMTD